jgi:hypothetical protein
MPTKKKNVCEKLENLTSHTNMMKEQGTTSAHLVLYIIIMQQLCCFQQENRSLFLISNLLLSLQGCLT